MSAAGPENPYAAPDCRDALGAPPRRDTPRYRGIARVLDEVVFPIALVFGVVMLFLIFLSCVAMILD